MGMVEIRWEQRFSNYKKAIARLKDVVKTRDLITLDELEKEGLIQRFEYTFELAWKTLQDLLQYKGYNDIVGPNPVLQQALKDGYIINEKAWRDMKKSRELSSHTYESNIADQIAKNIVNEYYLALNELENRLDAEVGK